MLKRFYRSGVIDDASGSDPDFGAAFTVTAYEVGAVVTAASSGDEITVANGHGFASGDKLLIDAGASTDEGTYREVDSVTATSITLVSPTTLTVSVGDVLINLGPDTGAVTPEYDASPIDSATDADATSTNTEARVTCDAKGNYGYWTQDRAIWELVRDGLGAPVFTIVDAVQKNPTGVNTFTDADATPSVSAPGPAVFKTANTGETTITGFDDGYAGQFICVIFGDSLTNIDFTGTNLEGNSGADWSPDQNDHMVCFYDGTNWFCDISDNTA